VMTGADLESRVPRAVVDDQDMPDTEPEVMVEKCRQEPFDITREQDQHDLVIAKRHATGAVKAARVPQKPVLRKLPHEAAPGPAGDAAQVSRHHDIPIWSPVPAVTSRAEMAERRMVVYRCWCKC